MRFIGNICYGKAKHSEQYLDMYIPDADSFKVFVYMHGGGMEKGDKSRAKTVGEYVASQGIAFVSINYRMYPQAMYPQFICDSAEAVAWVYNNIGEYGKCEGIYIGGSSAGGYLSMMLCFDNKYLAPYKIPEGVIKGYIHDAGQPTTHFNVLRERGIDSRRVIVDEAAPIYYLSASIPLPRLLLICYEDDIPCRPEQTKLFYRSALRLRPEADIELMVLPGGHCAGGTFRDDDGQYPYVKCALQFMAR